MLDPRRSSLRDGGHVQTIAVLGNHLPRRCGIATFTTHLAQAMADVRPAADCFVLAMNDAAHHHAYPSRVRFEIAQNDVGAYRRASAFLNVAAADVLSVQHEYGIFGGAAGAHVLTLLRDLRMPIVTTLHTILADPGRRPTTRARRVDAPVGTRCCHELSRADLLMEVHGVPVSKIDVIPHGIPAVPPATPAARIGWGFPDGGAPDIRVAVVGQGIEYVL
jgi:hypothetical protein